MNIRAVNAAPFRRRGRDATTGVLTQGYAGVLSLKKHADKRERPTVKLILWLPVLVITFAFNGVNASQTAGTSRLAQALESHSESVKNSIITGTEQLQLRNARRLKLRMQADKIRTQLLGATDAATQASLSARLQTLEKQLNAVR